MLTCGLGFNAVYLLQHIVDGKPIRREWERKKMSKCGQSFLTGIVKNSSKSTIISGRAVGRQSGRPLAAIQEEVGPWADRIDILYCTAPEYRVRNCRAEAHNRLRFPGAGNSAPPRSHDIITNSLPATLSIQ
jgi:hypothetical protein